MRQYIVAAGLLAAVLGISAATHAEPFVPHPVDKPEFTPVTQLSDSQLGRVNGTSALSGLAAVGKTTAHIANPHIVSAGKHVEKSVSVCDLGADCKKNGSAGSGLGAIFKLPAMLLNGAEKRSIHIVNTAP